MKTSRLVKVKPSSTRSLPDDLWREILSNLPVKSLLRFRCVSKSWLSLIHDPDFARLHLLHFNSNRHESHLLVLRRYAKEYSLRCSKTLVTTTAKLHFSQIGLPTPSISVCWVVSSIDGLFLLKYLPGYECMLWNPSIRKSLTLPPTPGIRMGVSNETEALEFGLGFDPLTKDYKHVRLFLNRASGLQSVAIFSVASSLWKSVDLRADGCSSRCRRGFRLDAVEHEALCLSGLLFTLAVIGDSKFFELVSFDLRSGVFASAKLPVEDQGDDSFRHLRLSMTDNGSSLAVIEFYNKGVGSMWVLEGVGAGIKNIWSWSKRYTFGLLIPRCDNLSATTLVIYSGKNGEMLLRSRDRMVTSYNLETRRQRVIWWKDLDRNDRAFPFMESLLLLK